MAKPAVFTSSASQARCVFDHDLFGADPHHADESKDLSLVAFRRNSPRRHHEGRVDRSAERAKRRHHHSLSGLRLPSGKVQVHVLHGDTLLPGVGFRPPACPSSNSFLLAASQERPPTGPGMLHASCHHLSFRRAARALSAQRAACSTVKVWPASDVDRWGVALVVET